MNYCVRRLVVVELDVFSVVLVRFLRLFSCGFDVYKLLIDVSEGLSDGFRRVLLV